MVISQGLTRHDLRLSLLATTAIVFPMAAVVLCAMTGEYNRHGCDKLAKAFVVGDIKIQTAITRRSPIVQFCQRTPLGRWASSYPGMSR